jgi:ABC-type uncharacterized transport system substrate-binding protein
MLSSDSYQQMRQGSRAPSSALYLDQPWSRQVALIRAALPVRHRVGVLYSSDNARVLPELRQALTQQGAQLVALPVASADQLAPTLESLLGQSDLLLALPDSAIYNSYTIRNILLGSYRRSVPLIGLSAAYVNAGALCAVYSSAEQQAEQAATMTATFLATRRLPAPQFPHGYQIAVNAEVARSLGVDLPPLEVLRVIPPSDAREAVDTSTGNHKPWSLSCRLRSSSTMPGCTRARRPGRSSPTCWPRARPTAPRPASR